MAHTSPGVLLHALLSSLLSHLPVLTFLKCPAVPFIVSFFPLSPAG